VYLCFRTSREFLVTLKFMDFLTLHQQTIYHDLKQQPETCTSEDKCRNKQQSAFPKGKPKQKSLEIRLFVLSIILGKYDVEQNFNLVGLFFFLCIHKQQNCDLYCRTQFPYSFLSLCFLSQLSFPQKFNKDVKNVKQCYPSALSGDPFWLRKVTADSQPCSRKYTVRIIGVGVPSLKNPLSLSALSPLCYKQLGRGWGTSKHNCLVSYLLC